MASLRLEGDRCNYAWSGAGLSVDGDSVGRVPSPWPFGMGEGDLSNRDLDGTGMP